MAKRIQVGGRIESNEVGGIVTGAAEILDDAKGKKQSVINGETDDELLRLDQSKQDNLTFDNVPTEGSNNPVKSGGVYAADKALSDEIEAILLLIPSAASALNKLVDTAMMNSSISTATATFRGTYNVVTDLSLTVDATHEQIAAALGNAISTADNNDYAFVQIPVSAESTDIRRTERYKFNGTAWGYEYDLNTSGFTAAQWAAINSGITLALVGKLIGLPTSAELQALLGQKQNTLTFDNVPTAGSANPVKSGGVHTAINDEKTAREQLANTVTDIDGRVERVEEVIPTGAGVNNQLVANNSMVAYVTSIIEAITASFTIATADGHINLTLTQTNGRVASLTLTTSDIASAQALTALTGRVSTAESDITSLGGRVSTNETDIANLQQLYNDLQQSKPVPVTALPETGQQQGVIYRLAGTTSYSDYMWNGSTWVLMATYNNAIDDEPVTDSPNLTTSGAVAAVKETACEVATGVKKITFNDYSEWLPGLLKIDGTVDPLESYRVSDFVEVDSNARIDYTNLFPKVTDRWDGLCLYNAERTLIYALNQGTSGPISGTLNMSDYTGVKYIRFSPFTNDPTTYPVSVVISEESDTDIWKEINKQKVVYIGSGERFTTLRDGIDYARSIGNCIVYVKKGIYNLCNEFANELSNKTRPCGIELGNNIHVIFLQGSLVTANYQLTGVEADDDWVEQNFEPFFCSTNFIIENIRIEASNTRYCIHDELWTSNVEYLHIYKNCRMKYKSNRQQSDIKYIQALGGGLGMYGRILIDGGLYVSEIDGGIEIPIPSLSYHSNNNCDSIVTIKDVYIGDDNFIRFGAYGDGVVKPQAEVIGCNMGGEIQNVQEIPGGQATSIFELTEWNNIVRG